MSVWADNRQGVREVLDLREYSREFPDSDVATCGTCRRSWDDSHVSGITPTPSGRCPFEYEHASGARLEGLTRELFDFIETTWGDPWVVIDDPEEFHDLVADFVNGHPQTTVDDYGDLIERVGSYEWSDVR